MKLPLSERALIAIIGAVQFVNVLDFMMVMPLGPDFAQGLNIPTSRLGIIGGAYTFAAALVAFVGAFFLDRFDRRTVLTWSMLGLTLGTLGGGLAWDFPSLIAARLLAGAFGGPATSVAISIVIDAVAPARRGRALGAVMGAFSIASIFGVPAGLELAQLGSWRTPFFAVGATCVAVTLLARFFLPPMRQHLTRARATDMGTAFASLLRRREALAAYAMVATTMMASFLIFPNIAAYLQFNLDYPREHLGFLYLVGGIFSFFLLRYCGVLTDRIGAFRVALVGTAVYCLVVILFFLAYPPGFPVVVLFAGMMSANSIRAVPMTTIATGIPEDHERAGFMSLRSVAQHLASSLGAGVSSLMLRTDGHGALVGMSRVALLTLCLGLTLPVLIRYVEQRLQQRREEPA